MKPSDFQKTVQCRFESCLKKVVRSVVKDYYKELNRRKNKEISFSELPDVLVDKMAVWDDYETDYTIFSVCGIDIRVLDDELAEALRKLQSAHGGQDPGAVYKGRQEKNDNLKLALAVGEILKNKGIDISYTRTGDVYQTPFEKAQLANQAGVDYFISFHRNSSPKENQYNGAEVLIYDKSGIKYQMAENILGALGEVGFREIGVKERPGLVVLRRTRMPALLIETGFINSEEDNKLFDNKFSDIAQGIADAILGSLDEETVQEPLYYRVQTGAFRKKENADRMLYQLLEKGYPSFMLHENGLYKVQTGAYQQIGNAVNMEQRLRDDGYSTVIVTK